MRIVFPCGLEQQRVEAERHLVAVVERNAEPLPHDLRDDAEDGARVLVVLTVGQDVQVQVAETMSRGHGASISVERVCDYHTPAPPVRQRGWELGVAGSWFV